MYSTIRRLNYSECLIATNWLNACGPHFVINFFLLFEKLIEFSLKTFQQSRNRQAGQAIGRPMKSLHCEHLSNADCHKIETRFRAALVFRSKPLAGTRTLLTRHWTPRSQLLAGSELCSAIYRRAPRSAIACWSEVKATLSVQIWNPKLGFQSRNSKSTNNVGFAGEQFD